MSMRGWSEGVKGGKRELEEKDGNTKEVYGAFGEKGETG